jgi:hypothetical protein
MDNRKSLWRLVGVFVCLMSVAAGGCASSRAGGPRSTQRFGPGQLTTEAVGSVVLDFADDHVMRMLETIDELIALDPSSANRGALTRVALEHASAAVGIATSPNPIIAMSDMVVMASLSREAVRRGAIDRTLTREERTRPEAYDLPEEAVEPLFTTEDRILYDALSLSERDARRLASLVFHPDQLEQLETLMANWWERNPTRRRVTPVRLDDFVSDRGASVRTASGGPRSLLGLLQLDPFASMDPAMREIAQSRLLAERVTFQINRLPLLVALHAQNVLYQSLTAEELISMRETAEEFGDASTRLAVAVERWPDDLAREREIALRQVADVVQAERDAAVRQIAEAVETERRAALADLESAVTRQREETFATLEQRSEQLQGTLAELSTALASADALAASTTETVRAVDDMNIENFQRLVATASESAASVERSLGAIERLAAPGAIDTEEAGINQSVTAATDSMRTVIDLAFRRLAMLIGLLLVGWVVAALVIRWIGPRFSRNRAA